MKRLVITYPEAYNGDFQKAKLEIISEINGTIRKDGNVLIIEIEVTNDEINEENNYQKMLQISSILTKHGIRNHPVNLEIKDP